MCVCVCVCVCVCRVCVCVCVCACAQLGLTHSDPMDCSPPGFSIGEIFQARALEWVVISSLRGSFPPRDWPRVSHASCVSYNGKQILYHCTTWEALS